LGHVKPSIYLTSLSFAWQNLNKAHHSLVFSTPTFHWGRTSFLGLYSGRCFLRETVTLFRTQFPRICSDLKFLKINCEHSDEKLVWVSGSCIEAIALNTILSGLARGVQISECTMTSNVMTTYGSISQTSGIPLRHKGHVKSGEKALWKLREFRMEAVICQFDLI